ncbi:MAG: hypothetical protein WA674_08475 [Candidatus Acidiferrales bacterium]
MTERRRMQLEKAAKMRQAIRRNKVGQSKSKYTKDGKKVLTYHVPPPQRARIQKRYISGESIRKIAKVEKRNRLTVTRIVRAPEVAQYQKDMREKFYGIGYTAINTVREAAKFDAYLAYKILEATGVVPTLQEVANVAATDHVPTEQERRREIMLKMIGIALDRHEIFGTPIHELEEKIGQPVPVPKKDKVQ